MPAQSRGQDSAPEPETFGTRAVSPRRSSLARMVRRATGGAGGTGRTLGFSGRGPFPAARFWRRRFLVRRGGAGGTGRPRCFAGRGPFPALVCWGVRGNGKDPRIFRKGPVPRRSFLAKKVHRATGGCGGEREGPDVLPEGARSPPSFIGGAAGREGVRNPKL